MPACVVSGGRETALEEGVERTRVCLWQVFKVAHTGTAGTKVSLLILSAPGSQCSTLRFVGLDVGQTILLFVGLL